MRISKNLHVTRATVRSGGKIVSRTPHPKYHSGSMRRNNDTGGTIDLARLYNRYLTLSLIYLNEKEYIFHKNSRSTGSAIGGRVSFNTNEDHDTMDGELVCRVLQLMNFTDSRLPQGGCEKLELAMLSFFEQFRKIYVSDQVQKNSKVYRRLSDVLGLTDESAVLSLFIRKMWVQEYACPKWLSQENCQEVAKIISQTLKMGHLCPGLSWKMPARFHIWHEIVNNSFSFERDKLSSFSWEFKRDSWIFSDFF